MTLGALGGWATSGCGARTNLPSWRATGRAGFGGTSVEDAGPNDATVDAPLVDALDDVALDAPPDAARESGCADGQREGFVDRTTFPGIAGCSGGFSLGGVLAFDPGTAPACPSISTRDTLRPSCARGAGDDGDNPTGSRCNVSDLCAAGWHVCSGAADVSAHSRTGCDGATLPGDPALFFISRQSSDGCGLCATGTADSPGCDSVSCVAGCVQSANTSNDVFGCGNFGATAPLGDCGPFDRFSNDHCAGFSGSSWTCNDDGTGLCEAYTVTHGDAASGGALCCRD